LSRFGGRVGVVFSRSKTKDPRPKKEARSELTQFRDSGRARGGEGEKRPKTIEKAGDRFLDPDID
jgi:hypothetical protein